MEVEKAHLESYWQQEILFANSSTTTKIALMKSLDANLPTYIQMNSSLGLNVKDTCVIIDNKVKYKRYHIYNITENVTFIMIKKNFVLSHGL